MNFSVSLKLLHAIQMLFKEHLKIVQRLSPSPAGQPVANKLLQVWWFS